jgi:hypothetical protein
LFKAPAPGLASMIPSIPPPNLVHGAGIAASSANSTTSTVGN